MKRTFQSTLASLCLTLILCLSGWTLSEVVALKVKLAEIAATMKAHIDQKTSVAIATNHEK